MLMTLVNLLIVLVLWQDLFNVCTQYFCMTALIITDAVNKLTECNETASTHSHARKKMINLNISQNVNESVFCS